MRPYWISMLNSFSSTTTSKLLYSIRPAYGILHEFLHLYALLHRVFNIVYKHLVYNPTVAILNSRNAPGSCNLKEVPMWSTDHEHIYSYFYARKMNVELNVS